MAQDMNVFTTAEIIEELFEKRLVSIGEAPALIGYSALYGRRKILDVGEEGYDYFYIQGRIFVTRQFLEELVSETEAPDGKE